MKAECANCKVEVPPESGYETTRGDVLCTACYLALVGSARLTADDADMAAVENIEVWKRLDRSRHPAGGPFGRPSL